MDTEASGTAVLVCQGRAAAHGRIATGRFSDPVALDLLREPEREVVEQVRRGRPPKGWGPRMRYTFVEGCAHLMVPRTVAIDDAVRARAGDQLVILGAGLDGRAWRMGELADTVVHEVDHPASQRDKLARLGSLTPLARRVVPVAVDLTRDDLGLALAGAGHGDDRPTTWLWEGVVPYLTVGQVSATVAALAARSASGSTLIANYEQPSWQGRLGRLIGGAMMRLARDRDPWRAEPHRSAWTPARFAALLAEHGFTVGADRSLAEISNDLGVPVPPGRLGGSLDHGRVLVADRR